MDPGSFAAAYVQQFRDAPAHFRMMHPSEMFDLADANWRAREFAPRTCECTRPLDEDVLVPGDDPDHRHPEAVWTVAGDKNGQPGWAARTGGPRRHAENWDRLIGDPELTNAIAGGHKPRRFAGHLPCWQPNASSMSPSLDPEVA